MKKYRVERISIFFSPLKATHFAWMFFTVHYTLENGFIFKRDFLQTRENMLKFVQKPEFIGCHDKSFDNAKLGIASAVYGLVLYM